MKFGRDHPTCRRLFLKEAFFLLTGHDEFLLKMVIPSKIAIAGWLGYIRRGSFVRNGVRPHMKNNLYAVVLAAGQGTRMKSQKHKLLHPVCGRPIIDWILGVLFEIGVEKTVVVVGHRADQIQEHVGDQVTYAFQEEQLGTAHAVMQVEPILGDKEGFTLVLNGDHPLFRSETFAQLIASHQNSNAAATVMSAQLENPFGYGRIIRGQDGSVSRIVEQKDANEEEQAVCEINTGAFCFDNQKLFFALKHVQNDNAQGEYYLPDVIKVLKGEGERIEAFVLDDSTEAMGVNNRIQLAEAQQVMSRRILEKHMLEGVTIIDPDQTYVDADVTIGPDTVIYPGTYLKGETKIGSGCLIGPGADLRDVIVGDDVTIRYSVIEESKLEEKITVGPYSYIRPQTYLGAETRVGSFVEMKNTHMRRSSKAAHLAYIGDADVGEGVNISCGAITVNYDGVNKHRTVIGDGAFIGCNTNLVAPVTVEDGAYIAAGSTITRDVPAGDLAIARQRQVNKPGYAKKLIQQKKKE